MATIQVLKPKFHIEECLDQVRECLEMGWTGSGFKTAQLEEKWKEYTGHPHACFLNSNTSGLHLAVNIFKRRFGWADGDEIISRGRGKENFSQDPRHCLCGLWRSCRPAGKDH